MPACRAYSRFRVAALALPLVLPLALTFALAAPVSAQWQAPPLAVKPIVVKELPHDPKAFTQGLLVHRGRFYESTGLYGQSSLREVDMATGKVLRQHEVPQGYFAEGLALQGGKLVQLTWKEGVAFRYSLGSWGEPQRLTYAGEGWGLTDWKDGFCLSNGSDTLTFLDRNFGVTRRLPVTLAGKPVTRLNELERARGLIWANIWYTDSVVAVDPRGGQVKVVLDASEIVRRSGRANADAVLNGIAHDPASGLFYLTGKNWPKVFVVRVPGLTKSANAKP
jgi:glutaminyl-peptide cyclotransferase